MQNHEAWLEIAREDLAAAKGLLDLELFSTTAYHCQQAAEKALKAYLVFKKHHVVKSHDLIQLIELSMRFDRDFEKILEAAGVLNPFSTRFRYPSEHDIPDLSDAKNALSLARKIFTFVVKKISEPDTGQADIF